MMEIKINRKEDECRECWKVLALRVDWKLPLSQEDGYKQLYEEKAERS